MLLDDENRNFQRMQTECPARFRREGSDQDMEGMVQDLSSSGLLMWAQHDLEAGSVLSVVVHPDSQLTPPLSVIAEVVRCFPVGPEHPGLFASACVIREILAAEY